ncbi:MAG: response regulator, partial [Myxococcota bacterium]
VAVEPAPYAPVELMAELEASLGVQARELGVELAMHLDAAVPPMLFGDRRRVQQIITNLAANALRFSPEGHVSVQLGTAAQDDAPATLRIVVCDDGVGMTPEVRERIFEPFFTRGQAGIPSSRGLGLTIVRSLVHALGGVLEVRSQPGVGTELEVQLPLEVAELRPSAPVATPLAGSGRVLVVDDDPLNRRMARAMLTKAGFAVVEASSGSAAIDAAYAEDFDLVLMDIDMPGMNGLEATRQLHAAERAAGRSVTPVVALTAHAMPELEARCAEAGMRGMQRKPVRLATLVPFVLAHKRRRVLVVDDDEDLRPLLRALLEAAQVEVHEAASAAQAEAVLEALAPRRPHALIVDLELPDRDGAQLARDLRARGVDVPILALTGHAADATLARAGGALSGALTKPVRRGELVAAVLGACDRPPRA